MFVSKTKYNNALSQAAKALGQAVYLQEKYSALLRERNSIVDRINAGEFSRTVAVRTTQFTDDEIQTLINLCHPDKHHGSTRANAMTVKLLELRKK